MKQGAQAVWHRFFLTGGCLLPSFFICAHCAWADTLVLKNSRQLKGLVVEMHADRVILSTEKGEVPVFLSGITEVRYDEPEQNFMQIGVAYEQEKKLGEALAFYEKAMEVNPDFEDAKKAVARVRNRFWAEATEGPREEIEKQQVIYDAWGRGRPIEEVIRDQALEETRALKERLGITLEKKGEWVTVSWVGSSKDAALAGLERNDRLVAIDGESLRYLSQDVVRRKMLVPRYSNFTVEVERDYLIRAETNARHPRHLGFQMRLEYQGLVLDSVSPDRPASQAGLKDEDLLIRVNGVSTRYLPTGKVVEIMKSSRGDALALTVRRAALLTRR